MNNFDFKSDEAFYLWGNGFVFHGQLAFGQISENDKVVIKTKNGDLYAKVNVISSLRTRKVIKQAKIGERIAVGLNNFSDTELNNIHERFNPEIDIEPDTTEFLNVEYPIEIYNVKKNKTIIKSLIKNWLKK